jgi:acyl CoA:acetate/3-ketoacid CoA transferase
MKNVIASSKISKMKILTAVEIANQVQDNMTIAISGSGGGLLEADFIFQALEKKFLETGNPKNLTLVHALGIGNGRGSGVGRFAHENMVRRVIGGHWTWSPSMQKLARDNKIEAYSFPAGVIQTLFRETGSKRPGVITKIGLETFIDPKNGGGKCNSSTKEELVENIILNGEDYLWYRPIKIDIAIIRGSVVDINGNISNQSEPADLDTFSVALAAHNCGGKVFVQVEKILEKPICPSRLVNIPGLLIDGVVINKNQMQTNASKYDPRLSGEKYPPKEIIIGEIPKGIRNIICQRALRELEPRESVNFGFGIPDGIPHLAKKYGVDSGWISVEQGLHNADLLSGELFGAGLYPQAILSSNDQFDIYSGGGIDTAFLGFGEIDQFGNVNVSRIGDDIIGPGGFIDISQTAKKIVFCGTFETRGLEVEINENSISINNYGKIKKIVRKVSHITFSGKRAIQTGQKVLYITERAVFELTEKGIQLIEIYEGIEMKKDVFERMEFKPRIKINKS